MFATLSIPTALPLSLGLVTASMDLFIVSSVGIYGSSMEYRAHLPASRLKGAEVCSKRIIPTSIRVLQCRKHQPLLAQEHSERRTGEAKVRAAKGAG
jgi:hypothetical protein